MLRWIYFTSFMTGLVPSVWFLYAYRPKPAFTWIASYLRGYPALVALLYARAAVLNLMAPRVTPSNLWFSLVSIWLVNILAWLLLLGFLRERRAGRL